MALPSDINSIKNLFTNTVVDNKEIIDLWTSWEISDEIREKVKGFGTVSIENGDSWHSISEIVYGTRDLWWVLILFNDVEDPFTIFFDSSIPESTNTIQIIKPEYISIILNDIRQKRIQKEEIRFDA
jgi:hypothetical protein